MEARRPYSEKYIKDLSPSDTFVSLSGVVVSRSDGSFILDDSTGELPVLLSAADLPPHIRVFGRLLPYDDGFRLQGDFFQDLSKIDKLLYKKVKDLLNKG